MGIRIARLIPLSVALAVAGSVAPAADRFPPGYLSPGEFDVTSVIEPAPRRGDPRYRADRGIFRKTRTLLGTPRGQLASADVDDNPAAVLRDFSCAVGVALTPADAPKLQHVAERAVTDTSGQNRTAKELYKRARPFHIDRGAVCEPLAGLGASYDYPSGHATRGWTWALVIAEAAPDRAQPVLERGRAFAESRFICGAHNYSAVGAGMLSAGATMTLVRTKPAYRADIDAARAEIAALRADPQAARPTGCADLAALVTQPVLPKAR